MRLVTATGRLRRGNRAAPGRRGRAGLLTDATARPGRTGMPIGLERRREAGGGGHDATARTGSVEPGLPRRLIRTQR